MYHPFEAGIMDQARMLKVYSLCTRPLDVLPKAVHFVAQTGRGTRYGVATLTFWRVDMLVSFTAWNASSSGSLFLLLNWDTENSLFKSPISSRVAIALFTNHWTKKWLHWNMAFHKRPYKLKIINLLFMWTREIDIDQLIKYQFRCVEVIVHTDFNIYSYP